MQLFLLYLINSIHQNQSNPPPVCFWFEEQKASAICACLLKQRKVFGHYKNRSGIYHQGIHILEGGNKLVHLLETWAAPVIVRQCQ